MTKVEAKTLFLWVQQLANEGIVINFVCKRFKSTWLFQFVAFATWCIFHLKVVISLLYMLYQFVVRHSSSLRRARAVIVLNFCSVTFLLNSWRVPMYSVSDGSPIVWLISQLCGIVPYLPSALQSGPQSRRALPWTAPTNSSLSLSLYPSYRKLWTL